MTACLIVLTIAFSPPLRALESLPPQLLSAESDTPAPGRDEAPPDSTTPLTPSEEIPSSSENAGPPPSSLDYITPTEGTSLESPPEDLESDEGTPVGQGANEGASAAKKKQWQNIALAAAAVVVAVTALILIANNNGHSKKK